MMISIFTLIGLLVGGTSLGTAFAQEFAECINCSSEETPWGKTKKIEFFLRRDDVFVFLVTGAGALFYFTLAVFNIKKLHK